LYFKEEKMKNEKIKNKHMKKKIKEKTRKTKISQSYEVNKILVTQKIEKEKTNLSHLLLFEVK